MVYEYSHSYEMYDCIAKQKFALSESHNSRCTKSVDAEKVKNDFMISELRRFRINNPKGYARMRITICFEDCLSKAKEIRKKGKTPRLSDDFSCLLKNLKNTIKHAEQNFGFDKNDFRRLCEENGWSYKLTFNLNPGA